MVTLQIKGLIKCLSPYLSINAKKLSLPILRPELRDPRPDILKLFLKLPLILSERRQTWTTPLFSNSAVCLASARADFGQRATALPQRFLVYRIGYAVSTPFIPDEAGLPQHS